MRQFVGWPISNLAQHYLCELEEACIEIRSVEVFYIRGSYHSVNRHRVTLCDLGQAYFRIKETEEGVVFCVSRARGMKSEYYWPVDMAGDLSVCLNFFGVRGNNIDVKVKCEHWPSLLKALRRMLA